MTKVAPWWWRLLILLGNSVVFVATAATTLLLLDALIDPFIPAASLWGVTDHSWPGLLVEWTKLLLGVLAGLFILNAFTLQLPLMAYGFQKEQASQAIQTGALTAISLLLLAAAFLWIGGWLHINRANFQLLPFCGWLLFFLVQPLTEEIVVRAFLQNQLHRFFGLQSGLWIPALVFGLLHLGNPHFSWIAGLEIMAGGLLMGVLYLHFGSVWAPWAMHAAWNFTQSTVLGFAVSGIDTYRLLQTEVNGPTWLTGGSFGLEGSLLSLVLSVVAIVYFWPTPAKELPFILAIQEQNLTEHESDSIA